MKETKKINFKNKKTRIMARVNNEELAVIHRKAFIYARGNMSEFLRIAALAFEDKKKC